MWDSLSEPWRCCMAEAWAAYCGGSLPIGAAITDASGRVVARGRNRIAGPTGAGRALAHHPLAHAEMNALLALDAAAHDPYACALYTTTEPCPLCFGAFYMSGLRVLHYAARDPWAGSTNLLGTTPYLSRKPIRISGPETVPGLDAIVTAMGVEQRLRTHAPAQIDRFLAVLRVADPVGVALGEALFAGGDLARWREAGREAGAAVDAVAALLRDTAGGSGR